MAKSLDEMASQGRAKLERKASSMASSYNAAKSRMKSGYGNTPFGPTRKSAYNAGVDGASYRAPDPDKWASNWAEKMRE